MATLTFPELLKALRSKDAPLHLSGLGGSSKGWLLARLFRETRQSFFILTKDDTAADELARETSFFLAQEATYCGSTLSTPSVFVIPSWDVAPFDPLSPHADVVASRLAMLYRLANQKEPFISLTSVCSISQKVSNPSQLSAASRNIAAHEILDRDAFILHLESAGYRRSRLVEDLCTFATRGGTLDLFSPLYPAPVRIELFGDRIESIRTFDPETQLSLSELSCVTIPPARPLLLPPLAEVKTRIKELADRLSVQKNVRDELIDSLSDGKWAAGSEWILPCFDPALSSIVDFLPRSSVTLFFNEPSACRSAFKSFEAEGRKKHEAARERNQLIADYEALYFRADETLHQLSTLSTGTPAASLPIPIHTLEALGGLDSFDCKDHQGLRNQMREHRQLAKEGEFLLPLLHKLHQWEEEGISPLFIAYDQKQAEQLQSLLSIHHLKTSVSPHPGIPPTPLAAPGAYWIALGQVNKGFSTSLHRLAILTEEDITQRRMRQHFTTARKAAAPITSLGTLREGDHVVHIDYGIGCFRGLKTLTLDGVTTDFALLVYRDGDKVYLPVYKLNLLQKYVGSGEDAPSLSKLGASLWEKTKSKVRAAVREMASELLKLYAIRQAEEGFSFSPPDALFREFESTFEFDETPEQMKAIEETLSDMHQPQPMDRLICGDVGFGKTEVAIRAAYKAVLDGKQVAILVPTTLLASQHFRTFQERLFATGTGVAMLSRMVPVSKQKKTLKELKEGIIDILIGTHRILSRDIVFNDLGLVIIDEEHRFGVRSKERLKQLRHTVDVLAMTATPIPRTLHMSIAGIRDISLIRTPPRDRLSIATYLCPFNDDIIVEAIARELDRSGQVFFMHNRIETIANMAAHLQQLLPPARIRFAHGQMNQAELDQTMRDFYEGNFDILVSTTIIESGLDFPNANTILINHADMFGLADLYQLRGRVGRSSRQAYAYLLIPDMEKLNPDAKERLEALERYSDLGSGFSIAYRDLEIRGGGTLLGQSQSGHIGAVGFELYTDLLNRTVQELRGLPPEELIDPDVNLKISSGISQRYIPEVRIRLELYQRLAQTQTEEELEELKEEMKDRFGPLPPELFNLCRITRIKQLLIPLRVTALDGQGKTLVYHFSERTPISPEQLLSLMEREPSRYRLRPDNSFVVTLPQPWTLEDALRTTEELLALN